MAKFGFYINADERGSFSADLRNEVGKTVYEIRAGNELAEGETSIFDDGFMRDKGDLAGLQAYMVQLGVLTPYDRILAMADFERQLGEVSVEDQERTRMRQHTVRLTELLNAAKAANPKSTPVIRNIEGGHSYFMCDGDLVCSPEGVPADYLQVHLCDDVPTNGLGADDLREINDHVDAWLASPTIEAMTADEEAALAVQEAAWSEAKREHATSRP